MHVLPACLGMTNFQAVLPTTQFSTTCLGAPSHTLDGAPRSCAYTTPAPLARTPHLPHLCAQPHTTPTLPVRTPCLPYLCVNHACPTCAHTTPAPPVRTPCLPYLCVHHPVVSCLHAAGHAAFKVGVGISQDGQARAGVGSSRREWQCG